MGRNGVEALDHLRKHPKHQGHKILVVGSLRHPQAPNSLVVEIPIVLRVRLPSRHNNIILWRNHYLN